MIFVEQNTLGGATPAPPNATNRTSSIAASVMELLFASATEKRARTAAPGANRELMSYFASRQPAPDSECVRATDQVAPPLFESSTTSSSSLVEL